MAASRRVMFWLGSAALIVVTLTTYARVYDAQFIPMDDSLHISENPHFSPLSWQGLAELWKRPYGDIYVPLSYTFFAGEAWLAQHEVAGGATTFAPWVFHLGNVLVHAFSALLVFAILRQLVADDVASLLGAAYFVVQPLQVESVAWISETRGTLAACLSFIAIYQYLRFRDSTEARLAENGGSETWRPATSARPWLHYALAFGAYLLALLAKPSAVAVPAMLLAIDFVWFRRSIWRSLACLAWWVLPALALIWITRAAQAARVDAHVYIPDWWQRPLVMLDALAFYLWKLLVPIGLGIDYGRTPEVVLASPARFVVALVPVVVAVALAFLPERRKWLTAGALFVAALLPVLGLVPFIAQDVSTVGDRFMYLAMLGPALAFAVLMTLPRISPLRGEAVIILFVLAGWSVRQSGYWHDQQTVFERGLEINPESPHAIAYVAESAFRQGEFERAEELFQRATQTTPQSMDAWNNLGAFYSNTGRSGEAIKAFERAVKLAGDDFTHTHTHTHTPRLHLAMIRLQQGEFQPVVEDMTRLLAVMPELSGARNYLAVALFNLEQYDEAARHWEILLEAAPQNVDVHRVLGETYAKLEDYAKAREHYRIVLQLRPSDSRALEWLRQHDSLGGSNSSP